jgi:hypothetical protein
MYRTEAQWQALRALAEQNGLGEAQLAGLAIGCPVHGNANMDFDGEGASAEVFCCKCPA